jgi:hypothetical protein
VAFGLACLTAALEAKAGSKALANRSELAAGLAGLPPGELPSALAAVIDFAWSVPLEPVGTGQRLLDWVSRRYPVPPPPDFEWQARADLA